MSLTCMSCKLLFSVPELHQEHYKSDWHRYNLKRRLAELPPVSKDEFEKRAETFQESTAPKSSKEKLSCDCCNKYFSTRNAMANHLKSKKHLDAESIGPRKTSKDKSFKSKSTTEELMDDDGCSEDGDEEGWESCEDESEEGGMKKIVVETNDCLFCDHQSEAIEDNVAHMTTSHSFFIPDIEYLRDLDGLIASLAAKILLHHVCLWCNGKGRGFKSVKSVRRHMFDKGHCKMLHEGEVLYDYADFYDYSSVDETKEIGDVAVIDDLLEDLDYQLVLPSGATIGHRSLAIYYKQNLKAVDPNNRQKVKKVLQQYRSLGYTGTTGPVAIRKARDIAYLQKVKNRFDLKVGIQNNTKKHFRQQVMF